jgi:hypothetical protein
MSAISLSYGKSDFWYVLTIDSKEYDVTLDDLSQLQQDLKFYIGEG